MKKLIAIALAALMLLAFAACGEDTAPASTNAPSTSTETPAATESSAPAENEASEPAESGEASAPAAPSGSLVAEDGTITVSTADLVVDINGTKVGRPYHLDDIAAAGLDVESLTDLEVSSGSNFSPNIFLDENGDYMLVPNYYNGGDASVSMTEAEANSIGFSTYSGEPVDQGVSIFGVKYGTAKAEVIEMLGEPAYNDGDYCEWTLDLTDADYDGTLYMYFTSDADDGLVTDVYVSAVDYGW
ncbi:MAG: hypothetical protein IKR21_00460 [Oscillospiraceae bacterium]|nr:hypothetical protein [Oscillospiraceae bacterium]